MTKTTIGIIGFGRFGKVLHQLFEDGFEVLVSSSSYRAGDLGNVVFSSFEETVARSEALFLAVPINKTGETAARLKPLLRPGQIVVDVCSVKEMPFRVLSETLEGTGAVVWPTHPMFGPDSAQNGFAGLTWVSCEDELDPKVLVPYTTYLERKGLTVFRTDCETHDRVAARTQGLTHLIGRYLNELTLASTPIDTVGYKRLCAVRDQTCNDTWELFVDLMRYNRFTREIQGDLENAVFSVSSRLCEQSALKDEVVVGIVGASDAIASHLLGLVEAKGIPATDGPSNRSAVRMDCTGAEEALSALSCGDVDVAAVPMISANGDLVKETLLAMGKHDFKVAGERCPPGEAGQGVTFILLTRRRCARP